MKSFGLSGLIGSSALLALVGGVFACSSGVSGGPAPAGAAGMSATSGGATGGTNAPGGAGATGGVLPSAGSSGASAAAGSGGMATGGGGGGAGAGTAGGGGSGSGVGGLPHAVASTGCGKPPGQALSTFVNYKETIPASELVTAKWQPREYWVRLPANYDANRPYPTVFVGPGCGGKGNNAQPIQDAAGDDAIVVGIDYSSAATGRDCFMTEAFPDPEVNYVEETAANVKAAFCVDESRLFIEGFSSGSWIAYLEGCVDGGPGGLFKGIGTATGNWQGSLPDSACKGPVAFMGSHDSGDPQGYNTYPGGRDHVLKLNGCTMPPVTTPYDAGPMVKAPTANSTVSCVQYMGCQAPTVFCTTTGLGHNDQVASGISTYGFWKFWMSLP